MVWSWPPNSTDLYFWYLWQMSNAKDISGQSATWSVASVSRAIVAKHKLEKEKVVNAQLWCSAVWHQGKVHPGRHFKTKYKTRVSFSEILSRKSRKIKKLWKWSTLFLYNFLAHSREIWGKSDNYVDLSPTPIPAHFKGGNCFFFSFWSQIWKYNKQSDLSIKITWLNPISYQVSGFPLGKA